MFVNGEGVVDQPFGSRVKVLSIMWFSQVDDYSMVNFVPLDIRNEERLALKLVISIEPEGQLVKYSSFWFHSCVCSDSHVLLSFSGASDTQPR